MILDDRLYVLYDKGTDATLSPFVQCDRESILPFDWSHALQNKLQPLAPIRVNETTVVTT